MKAHRRFSDHVRRPHRTAEYSLIFVFKDTLDSYIEKYTSLVSFLNPSITEEPTSDPAPEDQTSKAISLQVSSSPAGFYEVVADSAVNSYL